MRKCSVCGSVLHFVLALASAAFFIHSASGEESPYATGGEVTILKPRDYVTSYIHVFTNTAEAATFASTGLRDLELRYLVVGAGGAGGNTYSGGSFYSGGGGGGGGGVCEKGDVPFTSGSTWQIFVGAGGVMQTQPVGGESAISNGTVEVETVPGGGGGARGSNVSAKDGASGGGGKIGVVTAGKGTYTNSLFGVEYGPFNGGAASTSHGNGAGGGGAGAVGKGGGNTGTSANGGEGLVSDITGESLVYGSGGGGGWGCKRNNAFTDYRRGGIGGSRAGNGATYEITDDGATTNYFAATLPAANSGGGGAGGPGRDPASRGDDPTPGADGIVVIRYDVWDSPCEGGDILTKKVDGLVTTWIHQFTNTAAMAEIRNVGGYDLRVRYLVVGAGGPGGCSSGGGSYSGRGGGGGGGGGGVCEKSGVPFTSGSIWQIYIGKGGVMARGKQVVGGTSAISNDVADVETVPGGGGGAAGSASGGTTDPADGASGGGQASFGRTSGGKGTYTNSLFGVAYGPFNGGSNNSSGNGAGGGGAGQAGFASSTSGSNGKGGEGLASDITGEWLVYGSGGGGGMLATSAGAASANGGKGGTRAGDGARYEISEDKTTTNFFAATMPVANSGSGGGSGGGKLYAYQSTPGADGIVVISYKTYSDDCPCWGGDVVTRTLVRGTRYIYRHYFTRGGAVDSFVNKTGQDLKLRYLVVGAGGAGGTANGNSAQAGGGGGGGGVCEKSQISFAVGSAWQITVGRGAAEWAETAGASSISNGTANVETVPGGGNGASPVTATATKFYYATPGAGGGGGVGTSGGNEDLYNKGADGTYASSLFGVAPEGAPFAGGSCKVRAGGGGGGASAVGVPSSAKSGGEGLVSNITGEPLVYGSGGGGGAGANEGKDIYYQGGLGGSRAGDGGYYTDENGNYTPTPPANGTPKEEAAARAVAATDAAPNSGGGGGGAFGQNASGKNAAGKGADGIVVIRYVYDPTPPGLIFMVR